MRLSQIHMRLSKISIRSVAAALVIVLLALCFFQKAEAMGDDEDITYYTSGVWEYKLDDGEAVITDYSGTEAAITIPSTIGGYTVTKVGENVFENSKITSVKFPNTIREIEYAAFNGCTKLKTITWGKGLKEIGLSSFSGCTSLTSVSIPDGVTVVEGYAFYGCSKVGTLTIPKSVGSLETCAFAGMTGLKKINFNAVNCSTGSSLFENAGATSGSVSVVFGNTVKTVPDSLFLTFGDDYARITSVSLPDSVTSIGDYAFSSCRILSKIAWGNGLKKMGYCVFDYCNELTEVSLPEGLTTVDGWIFNECYKLKTVFFPKSLASTEPLIYDCPALKKVIVYNKSMDHFLPYYDYDDGKVTVYCYKNSNADTFSQENNYKIVYLTQDSYFPDVPPTHNYEHAVYWAVNRGIAAGYSNGYFGIGDNVTRGQVAMFLWRAFGKPEPLSDTQTFKDVPKTHNFYKAIQWCYEEGITGGYTGDRAGYFGPSDNCTRGQIVMFLWRATGSPDPMSDKQRFTDVPVTHKYYRAIEWAAKAGITAGYSDGSFGVNKTCTRGHCVTFMYRLMGHGE